jgi:hypothetical protein
MGGRIGLDSEVGRGSIFHFDAKLGLPADVSHQRPAAPMELEGARVLVVDDNATTRRILTEILESWRMQPVAVERAEQALQAIETARRSETPFRLLLTDRRCRKWTGSRWPRGSRGISRRATSR